MEEAGRELLVGARKRARVVEEEELPAADAVQIGLRVGGLKRVLRTGWIARLESTGQSVESVADHSFRMACLAMLVHQQGVDVERLVCMSLLHDFAETIVGDIAPSQNIPEATKHRLELDAMLEMRGEVKSPLLFDAKVFSLWREYEQRQSPEAKLVKDLDRFEMCLQAYEYELASGVELEDFFHSVRGKLASPQVQQWFDRLEQLRRSTAS